MADRVPDVIVRVPERSETAGLNEGRHRRLVVAAGDGQLHALLDRGGARGGDSPLDAPRRPGQGGHRQGAELPLDGRQRMGKLCALKTEGAGLTKLVLPGHRDRGELPTQGQVPRDPLTRREA